MTDRIKAAFDDIHAEDALKKKTLEFLQSEMNKKGKPEIHFVVRRFAVSFALLLCIVLTGIFSYDLYFTESAYIDFDINPSVELTVNRFDRVTGVHAYNSDGEGILEGLDIKYKNYKDAISSLLGAFAQKGYLQNNGLVSVTLQTNDSGRESKMLSGLAMYVETNIHKHHGSAQIDVFPVSGEVRNDAYELDLSPAKYLAILELQEVDPTATLESCRGHTIGELKSLTQIHGAGHHAENSANETEGDNNINNQDLYPSDTSPHHGETVGQSGHRGRHG